MNEKIILDMVQPYLQDGKLTYQNFENIFSMLSQREKYKVCDLLYMKQIELVNDENEEYEFEVLYDDEVFAEEDITPGNEFLVNRDTIYISNNLLIRQIQEGSLQAKQDLCVKNERLVYKLANEYYKMFGNKLDFEDLKQAGMMGMLKAAERFDFAQETQFSTYAVFWIKQSILRTIYDTGYTIRIPVHKMEQISKIVRYDLAFALEKDFDQRLELIAESCECTTDAVKECLILYNQFLRTTSLDTPIGEEEENMLGDIIPDDHIKAVEDEAIESVLKDTIKRILTTLTDREKDIICARFGLNNSCPMTLEEIGERYHLTRERIRQIEAKALKKLRHPNRVKILKGFLE